MQRAHILPVRFAIGHPIFCRLAWHFLPICQGFRGVPFPAAFSMLCCEAYFAVIIITCFTMHFCRLVYGGNGYIGQRIEEGRWHAPSHSMQYPCATSRSVSSSSQLSGLMSGCSNLSWSFPRMFSRENVGPLLCDAVADGSEDAISTRVDQKR